MTNSQIPKINVTLRDEEGKKVTQVRVPNFVVAPEAIVWEGRVFSRRSRSNYWECFTYVVPAGKPQDAETSTVPAALDASARG